MTPTHWTLGTLAVLGAMSAAAWRESRLLERISLRTAEEPNNRPEAAGLLLEGELNPDVTSAVDSAIENLAVAPGSWVRRGQVLGDAGAGAGARRERALARARLAAASFEEEAAEKALENVEQELDETRSADWPAQQRAVAAESGQVRTVHEVEEADHLLRTGSMSGLQHDEVLRARQAASSELAEAEAGRADDQQTLASLELGVEQAQAGLETSMRLREEAESALLMDLYEAGALNPVLAPEDGMFVALDRIAGRYGIARDPSRLTVLTHVRPYELAAVQVGRKALVFFRDSPEWRMRATVSEIAAAPVESPEGPVYEVRLRCDNPEGVRMAGVRVRVRIGELEH
jgi:hypothetical protein